MTFEFIVLFIVCDSTSPLDKLTTKLSAKLVCPVGLVKNALMCQVLITSLNIYIKK